MAVLANALLLTIPFLNFADDPAKTTAPDAKQIKNLIKDLGSDEFKVREKATKELSGLGRTAARCPSKP